MRTSPMSRTRRRFRDRHGAAVLAVTILGVAAATLAVLIVRQVIVSARATVFEQLSEEARELAGDAVADALAQLEADPALAFRRVLDAEVPRRCVVADPGDADLLAANPDHPVYAPGADWPAACGVWWEHEPATVDPVALKVQPPTADADLAVQALAVAGKVQAGVSAELTARDAGGYALWTVGNLSLDEVADGAVTIEGLVYATDRILLPSSAVTFGDAQLAAEEGFVGALDDSGGLRFYAATPDTGADPPVRDIRDVVPVEGSRASLASAIAATAEVACPSAGAPVVVTRPGGDRASHLCLQPGQAVRDTTGALVTVPDAGAFLVLPDASAAGTVDVYHRGTPVDVGLCRIRCDLYGLAQTDVAAGDHPGITGGWDLLGTLAAPVSGVVGSPSAQTHVGLCGDAFVGSSLACGVSAPAEPLTVVAGGPTAPHDLIIGGPVSNLGLVATGDVRLAYWAGPAGGDVTVDAHLATSGTFAGLPTTRPNAPQDATGGTLTLSGSLVVADLHPLRGFAGVQIVPSGAAATPWLAGPDAGLEPRRAQRLSPLAACGSRVCDPW